MQRMHGWIGRKDRQPVTIDAVVHRSDGTQSAVKLTNVSDEGCRIETDRMFRIGERLEIEVPELAPIKAQIRWALSDSAGAQFLAEPAL